MGCGLPWACRGLVHAVTSSVSSHVQLSCCVQKSFTVVTHHLWLSHSFHHPPQWPLSLWRRDWSIHVPFRAEHSSAPYSLHYGQLWASLLPIIYCKQKKLLSQRLRGALIYGYNDKPWEVSLLLYWFSRIMDFFPESMTCLAIDSRSNKGDRDGFLFVEWALNPIKNGWLFFVFGQLLHQ